MKKMILKPSLLALSLILSATCAYAGASPGQPATWYAASAVGRDVYNPWLDFIHMQAAMNSEFNALAQPFWMPVLSIPPAAFMAPVIQDNTLKRTDEGYQLEFRMPRYKPEDIHVRLDGRQLTVSAESSTEGMIKVGQQSEQSQSSRTFAETLTLPGAVQASGLKESYKDGVLTVIVPSAQDTRGSS